MANNENKITTIEQGIEIFSMGHVYKRKELNYNGIIWIILGLAALTAQTFDTGEDSLSMALLIIGICLVFFGAIALLSKKERYFYDDKPMKMREFLFDQDRMNDVMKLYDQGKFSDMVDISRNSESKMKLKFLYATDYSVAFSQIYKFVNYDFVPTNIVRKHDKAQCSNLNSLIISY